MRFPISYASRIPVLFWVMAHCLAICPLATCQTVDAQTHFNLGVALIDQGKPDEAITSFRRAIELDPELAEAHYNLGLALAKQAGWGGFASASKSGKLDEAIASYRRAIEIDPEFAGAHNNLGLALFQQGKMNEALASFRRAIEIDPELASAHNSLGLAMFQQAKMNEAIASFRRVIEIDPELARAHYSLGLTLAEQDKLDEAIESYRRAIELAPRDVDAHIHLATAYAQLGQVDRCGIWIARMVLAQGVADERSLVKAIDGIFRQLEVEFPAEKPTDQEVRAYYEANKKTFSGVAVHLRTLAIPKSRKTREFVDELRAKLVAGDGDFAAAAKKYSFDNASPNGGDRGWVKRGELSADLLDVAFALKAGRFSAVIEDDRHYHILNTVEHRDGSLVPLEKVREEIVAKLIKETPTKLIREAQAKRIKGWIEQARKEHAEAMEGA